MEVSEILSRLEKILGPEELAAVAAELHEAHSRGNRHWLEDVMEAAEELPLPEVPPLVRRELRSLVGGPKQLESHDAVLVSDSRLRRTPAGVRGSDAGQGFSLTYASEVADLIVDVWPLVSGDVAVEGHLMPHAGLHGAVRAAAEGLALITAGGDELGRFRFERLSPARYRLTVEDGRVELTATVDLEVGP